MRKIRGFKIGKKFLRVSGWLFRRTRTTFGYNRLAPPKSSPITKLIDWGRRLVSTKPRSGYHPIGPAHEKAAQVPKGHLALYVGKEDGEDLHRVLVPVIYINHPLFSEFLREAEEEFGFSQEGGITIPCRFSEFERVQTRIRSTRSDPKCRMMTWKRNYQHKHRLL